MKVLFDCGAQDIWNYDRRLEVDDLSLSDIVDSIVIPPGIAPIRDPANLAYLGKFEPHQPPLGIKEPEGRSIEVFHHKNWKWNMAVPMSAVTEDGRIFYNANYLDSSSDGFGGRRLIYLLNGIGSMHGIKSTIEHVKKTGDYHGPHSVFGPYAGITPTNPCEPPKRF